MPARVKTFRDRHDVVAFGSVVAVVVPLAVGGSWLATHAGLRVLDVGGADLARSWQGVVLLAGGMAGFGSGLLLGSVLWMCAMRRLLPPRTVRRWMLGDGGGRLRPYAERIVDRLVAPSC
jgi:hypothetical protein